MPAKIIFGQTRVGKDGVPPSVNDGYICTPVCRKKAIVVRNLKSKFGNRRACPDCGATVFRTC